MGPDCLRDEPAVRARDCDDYPDIRILDSVFYKWRVIKMAGNAFQKWADEYQRFAAEGLELLWPSETLVRLFKGSYIPDMNKEFAGRKALDVGFGGGNNLAFLGSLGLELYGTEVHEGICESAREKFGRLNYRVDLRVGTNRNLPFDTGTFDYLVSWNVLHYEDNEDDIQGAILEYHRVLKPGGRFMLSTTGPEHKILLGSELVGAHRYRIGREDDFRKGQVFFYFDSPAYIHYYFGKHFRDVLVGRTHDYLFTETLDWFIVTGVKP